MKNKTGKEQPRKRRGADTVNRAHSAWKDGALRYFLLIELICCPTNSPRDKKWHYDTTLCCLEFVEGERIREMGGNVPSGQWLREFLKYPTSKSKLDSMRAVYDANGALALLDFHIDEVPTTDDVATVTHYLSRDERQAAIEVELARHGLTALTGRTRQYQQIVNQTVLRLKALLAEAEHAWDAVSAESKAHGISVGAFPGTEILAGAFPECINR